MSPKAATTPWEDGSELSMVRDWFYPDRATKDPYSTETLEDMRKEAIARVNIWTFKSHRVPPAVLCTADLTDSILHYEGMAESGKSDEYRAVQFMFAFAFLRFVNAFVDRDVAKVTKAALATSDDEDMEDDRAARSAGESSMYAHAAAIAMPSRFVDLRHQVSHGAVPEIRALRKASCEALTWLWHKWWKAHASDDPGLALARFQMKKEQKVQREQEPNAKVSP